MRDAIKLVLCMYVWLYLHLSEEVEFQTQGSIAPVDDEFAWAVHSSSSAAQNHNFSLGPRD